MGKRMFDGGERFWPEEAPFHTGVFVLTKQIRGPWERPGGTTFYFVNDGIESALRQAREAAGGKDIRIAGGANVILQYLNARLDLLALSFLVSAQSLGYYAVGASLGQVALLTASAGFLISSMSGLTIAKTAVFFTSIRTALQ